jgi:hypothetical protein
MRNEQYDVEEMPSPATYTFVSEGRKGRIIKIIKYIELENSGIYNLGFGDKLGDSEDFDDKIVSNNGDRQKILATVAATIYDFTNKNPMAFVAIKGSSLSRTRLYRINISNFWEEISQDFHVFGQLDKRWYPFEHNQDYAVFLLKRK